MVVICEPECSDYAHSKVNAGMINAFSKALNEEILFVGEAKHVAAVGDELSTYSVQARISVQSLTPSDVKKPYWERKQDDKQFIREIFSIAGTNNALRIVFLSVNTTNLHAIQLESAKHRNITVIIVLHGILESLVKKRPPIRPLNLTTLRNFRYWFGFTFFKADSKVKYIVNSPFIKTNLLKLYPKLKHTIIPVHIPYNFFPEFEYLPFIDSEIKIGHFGIANPSKGGIQFNQIVEKTAQSSGEKKVGFYLIGYNNSRAFKLSEKIVCPSLYEPLTETQFTNYAKLMDYALFCYSKNSYILTMSGAFFDAISFAKPIIAIKNTFFEYYFDMFGDIGYLCNSYDEITATIHTICKSPDMTRYNLQRKNIYRGRTSIGIEQIAAMIRSEIGKKSE